MLLEKQEIVNEGAGTTSKSYKFLNKAELRQICIDETLNCQFHIRVIKPQSEFKPNNKTWGYLKFVQQTGYEYVSNYTISQFGPIFTRDIDLNYR